MELSIKAASQSLFQLSMLPDKPLLNQLRFLTVRTLKTRYAGTALGTIWAFALPLLQIFIYILVFGFLFKSKLPGSDKTLVYVIWFLLGYSPWMLFSECLTASSSCMQANAGLIKSFPFRKPVIVYSVILSALPQLLLCLLISLVLMVTSGVSLMPAGFLYQALGISDLLLIVVVLSLCFSLLGLVLRDLPVVLPQVLMMLLFASPVFFPASVLPGFMAACAKLNPLIVAIDLIRAPIQAPTGLVVVLGAIGFPIGCLIWRLTLRRYKLYEGVIASMV
jgi:lipopolysaccharide transport system permease protein